MQRLELCLFSLISLMKRHKKLTLFDKNHKGIHSYYTDLFGEMVKNHLGFFSHFSCFFARNLKYFSLFRNKSKMQRIAKYIHECKDDQLIFRIKSMTKSNICSYNSIY